MMINKVKITTLFVMFITLFSICSCDSLSINEKVYNPDEILSLQDYKTYFDLDYYSSLLSAIEDVNNGTIGENSDSDMKNATAGIFTSEESVYVVLLKDSTEKSCMTIRSEMTLILCGNSLSVDDTIAVSVLSDCTIDGRFEGSSIEMNKDDGQTVTNIFVQAGKCNIIGGSYKVDSVGANASCIQVYEGSELIVSDASISATETENIIKSVFVYPNAMLTMENCEVMTNSQKGTVYSIYISEAGCGRLSECEIQSFSEKNICCGLHNQGELSVTSCTVNVESLESASCAVENMKDIMANNSTFISKSNINACGVWSRGDLNLTECIAEAYSNYHSDDQGDQSSSIGIMVYGISTITDCYSMGTHSGISVYGETTINGGTYESFGHGGIYFCGPGKTSYVRDATIRSCEMPEGYTYSKDNDNDTGFYIGGGLGADNIVVYMDNCDIYGEKYPIVLRGTDKEKYNYWYISNSRINTESPIRIDNGSHKLYLGAGNNFGPENSTLERTVVETEEVYIKHEIEE